MAIRIEVSDGATPMLEEIIKLNYGMGLDALDQAGNVMREATRRELKASRTQWSQYYRKGKKRIYKTKSARRTGRRLDHVSKGGTADPESMANFITSNLMEKQMVMVVAGKHKRLKPKTRRNGKVVGFQKAVGSVTKTGYAILQKLNSGEVDGDYASKVRSREDSMPNFKDAIYRKRNFIEKGRRSSTGRVRDIMTSKLESLLHKEINRANVKSREVKTA